MENRVRFKIGEIEFEAEGSAEVIESQRDAFLSRILPVAVDAVVKTRGSSRIENHVEYDEEQVMLSTIDEVNQEDVQMQNMNYEFDRTSLVSFLKNYGDLNDQDFALISVYYDEKKNNIISFTSENVKKNYAEARRAEYSNVSALLRDLVKKGYIMDDPDAEGKSPKKYKLTLDGIKYIENYQPKDKSTEKKSAPKSRKSKPKEQSVYVGINVDDLNLHEYPQVKDLGNFKEKMLLILYSVGKKSGDGSFSVIDIQYLMTDIFGFPATTNQINGVFRRNKTWFKKEEDPNNKRICRYTLLQGAKEFVESLIMEKSNK